MELVWISPAQRAHMNAVTEAGVNPRVIALLAKPTKGQPATWQATFVCPRKRGCSFCSNLVGDALRINLGLLQRRLPVKVEGIPDPESAPPAAPRQFPEVPSV